VKEILNEILIPVSIVGGIALFFGVILTIAGKFFEVKKNEKAEAIREILPGANCGACGYSGCDLYAEAVAEGKAEGNLCIPGTNASAIKIGEILGVKVATQKTRVMKAICCPDVSKKYTYSGIKTCAAASLAYRGENSCLYSCLGYGDCVAACPNGAIMMKNGAPVIDPVICTECGLCAKTCPRNLIRYLIGEDGYYVACASEDSGRITGKNCKNGCIACNLCVKACQDDAIHVINNVAVIDYEKCTRCGKCYDVCPKKIIKKFCSSY
jgi:RnfABCDGE-type electron transport complex B subunit